jgi:hypothetical protein
MESKEQALIIGNLVVGLLFLLSEWLGLSQCDCNTVIQLLVSVVSGLRCIKGKERGKDRIIEVKG